MAFLFTLLFAFAFAGSTPAGTPFPAAVTLTTADGVALHASVGAPAKADKGVVFVHMAGRNKEDWAPIAEKLYRQGLMVLTVDLRGHGANVTGTPPTLTEAEWAKTTEDVKAGVAELRRRGAQKVALVGAEVGANLALIVASEDAAIASVTMLSPGLDYKGLLTPEPAKRYGARPLFLVSSADDAYGTRCATQINTLVGGGATLQAFESAGKGTRMFSREPTLESLVMGFVNSRWSGTTVVDDRKIEVRTGP